MKLESIQPPDLALQPQPESLLYTGRRYAAALTIAVVITVLALYADTVSSLVRTWYRSETFTHGFLIVPISLWLIWRRRHELASVPLRPNPLMVPLLAVSGFVWLLGQLGSTDIVQQYALLVTIVLSIWSVLGTSLVRALAFPLFFLVFAIPVGEILLPPLMEQTANFTVLALRLSGIPVHREGLFFSLPTGNWSVIEACSGLRYLIASLTIGVLYAYLTYRSFARRAMFIAAAVAVPIVANWLRAYMIVMIGHLSSMKYATGVDHLIYGWIFFGVVMVILFWVGAIWREEPEAKLSGEQALTRVQPSSPSLRNIVAVAFAATVIAAAWPLAAARLIANETATLPRVDIPAAAGWTASATPLTDWTPHFLRPPFEMNQIYAKGAERVGLYLGYYRKQHLGAELVSSVNVLVLSNDQRWGKVEETRHTVPVSQDTLPVTETQLRGHSTRLLVWRWYWVDGHYTDSQYWAKLLEAKSRLFGRGDDGVVIVVYTELDNHRDAAAGRLESFVNSMLPALTRSLDHARTN